MKHIVYMTVNNVNGKFYIGKHSTNNILDNYLGSGKALKNAIKKYGSTNFTKHILGVFDTEEEAFLFESSIVDESFIIREDTYNITLGGKGNSKFGYYDKDENIQYKHAMNCDKIRQKARQTNLQRYGGEHPLQNSNIQKKMKHTMIEKYGVDNSLKLQENREKGLRIIEEKYGTRSPIQNKEVKEKYQNTMEEKYGVDVPLKSESIKQKYNDTIKEKYGVSHVMHVPEINKKAADNRRKYIWINDGTVNKKVHKNCELPLGFKVGKLKNPKNASVAAYNRPKKTCPLCNSNIDSSNFNRHFVKCSSVIHTSIPE